MFAGNLAAIPQVNVKRMLAYSSIAHAGYLLVGIIVGAFGDLNDTGTAGTVIGGNGAVLYYLLTYAFSTFLVLGAISLFGKDGEEFVHLSDFAGMGFKRPFVGLAITVGLLSLAGIPPLGGFFAKFYLFREAMSLQKPEMVWLTLLAIVNSMIALYYYLRVIVFLYMKEPTREVPVYESKGAVAVLCIALVARCSSWACSPTPTSRWSAARSESLAAALTRAQAWSVSRRRPAASSRPSPAPAAPAPPDPRWSRWGHPAPYPCRRGRPSRPSRGRATAAAAHCGSAP